MATPADSPSELLQTLLDSLTATTSSLPTTIPSPPNGLSLLDIKNDLLLSYLHHLSFLLLFRTRSESFTTHQPAVNALVKLRAYLDRGVKPLEQKLKYQIDKAVQAAAPVTSQDDEDDSSDESSSGSDSDSDVSDSEESVSGDEETEKMKEKKAKKLMSEAPKASATDLAYRPNPMALLQGIDVKSGAGKKTTAEDRDKGDGIYRPPKIAPVLMPEENAEKAKGRTRPERSRLVDEYVNEEISQAPIAEPSIGTTIMAKGRSMKSARERREEQERREYEESNFVRLPKLSKKEMAAKNKMNGGARHGAASFGGEDWTTFAGDLDKLTKRGSGPERVLDRSRKRRGDDDEGAGGTEIGKRFEGRKNILKKRRKM